MDRQAVQADEVLGKASIGEGLAQQTLVNVAFSLKEFHAGAEKSAPLTEAGKVFPRAMDLNGPGMPGKLVWGVVSAAPAAVPQDVKEVHDQVVLDCKLRRAYEVALDKARQAVSQAQAASLANVAYALGKQVIDAKDLRRRALVNPATLDPLLMYVRSAVAQLEQWMQSRQKGPPPTEGIPYRLFLEAALTAPVVEITGIVPRVTSEESGKQFLSAVFDKLAPTGMADSRPAEGPASQPAQAISADSRPSTMPTSASATQPASAPAPADAITVVGLTAERAAMVVQRVKYTPAYEDKYLEARPVLMEALYQMRLHELMLRWYDQKDIFQRTGFAEDRPE